MLEFETATERYAVYEKKAKQKLINYINTVNE